MKLDENYEPQDIATLHGKEYGGAFVDGSSKFPPTPGTRTVGRADTQTFGFADNAGASEQGEAASVPKDPTEVLLASLGVSGASKPVPVPMAPFKSLPLPKDIASRRRTVRPAVLNADTLNCIGLVRRRDGDGLAALATAALHTMSSQKRKIILDPHHLLVQAIEITYNHHLNHVQKRKTLLVFLHRKPPPGSK
jgi:hypothetical protein